MKGMSFKEASPVKVDPKPENMIQDPNVEQGYQGEKGNITGVQTFKSVERLKQAGAPKEVIAKEYAKQVGLYKASRT